MNNFYFFYYNKYGGSMFKYRRFMAFLLDIFMISLLTVLLSNSIANPNRDIESKYIEAYEEKVSSIDYSINSDPLNYFKEHIGREFYDYIKGNVYEYIYFLLLTVSYFGIFCYFNNGKTIGLLFSRMRIVKKNKEKAGILRLIGRSMFMGTSIMSFFPISALLYIIIPRVFDANSGFVPLIMITGLLFLLEGILLIFFLFNKKNMGLHDYICSTKIIDTRK